MAGMTEWEIILRFKFDAVDWYLFDATSLQLIRVRTPHLDAIGFCKFAALSTIFYLRVIEAAAVTNRLIICDCFACVTVCLCWWRCWHVVMPLRASWVLTTKWNGQLLACHQHHPYEWIKRATPWQRAFYYSIHFSIDMCLNATHLRRPSVYGGSFHFAAKLHWSLLLNCRVRSQRVDISISLIAASIWETLVLWLMSKLAIQSIRRLHEESPAIF